MEGDCCKNGNPRPQSAVTLELEGGSNSDLSKVPVALRTSPSPSLTSIPTPLKCCSYQLFGFNEIGEVKF